MINGDVSVVLRKVLKLPDLRRQAGDPKDQDPLRGLDSRHIMLRHFRCGYFYRPDVERNIRRVDDESGCFKGWQA